VGPNPTDGGKGGDKRSLLADGKGIPVGLVIDGANRHDCKLVERTLDSIPIRRPKPTRQRPQRMCMDKGYDFELVLRTLAEYNLIPHIRHRGEEARARRRPRGKPRRWVVERSHSWFNRFRRILVSIVLHWDAAPGVRGDRLAGDLPIGIGS
jgi:putative transposase